MEDWIIIETPNPVKVRYWHLWEGKWTSNRYPGVWGTIEILLIHKPCSEDKNYTAVAYVTSDGIGKVPTTRVNVEISLNDGNKKFSISAQHEGYTVYGTFKITHCKSTGCPLISGKYKCPTVHDSGKINLYDADASS